jgi:hypothetical protein
MNRSDRRRIANETSSKAHAATDRRIFNGASTPDLPQKLALGNCALSVPYEIHDKVKNEWLDIDYIPISTNEISVLVHFKVPKRVPHVWFQAPPTAGLITHILPLQSATRCQGPVEYARALPHVCDGRPL